MYGYEAVHQQSRRDGGRREGGGYRAVARFTRGGGGEGQSDMCKLVYLERPYSKCRQIVLLNSQ